MNSPSPTARAAQSPAPALSFDVSEVDFEAAVVDRSIDTPVLLDCWAPWCAPCRSLKPVLEKLAQDYGGRFVLAKLNTDEAPQISAALGLRSIPQVMLFMAGQPVDQFSGALPEAQVRAFLDRHLPPAAEPAEPIEAALPPVEQLRAKAAEITATDPHLAEELLHQAMALDPGHTETRLDLAESLLARGELERSAALLETPAPVAQGDRHARLLGRLALASTRPEGDAKALADRIAVNSRDFDARFALATLLAHAGDFGAAFAQLLETVLRDKAEAREQARAKMVQWLAICPDAALVDRSRRQLSMYLN